MKLIVDSGSTKTEWVLLNGNTAIARFYTNGFNPNYSDVMQLDAMIADSNLPTAIQNIHYYGTGCGNEQNCLMIKDVLQNRFPNAEITVTHDLMAACHALLGHEKGIACILGTGSNACVYDGEKIAERAVSLGYLVGDEGSGMHIGREVVRAYFYGFMPEDLRQQFEETYHLELKDFIERAYHQPQPSKYLASFAKFAGGHQNHPFIHALVRDCFDAFAKAFLLRFTDCQSMKIGFVGSVAFHFHDILKECMQAHGLMIGEVMASPAEGLVQYYSD